MLKSTEDAITNLSSILHSKRFMSLNYKNQKNSWDSTWALEFMGGICIKYKYQQSVSTHPFTSSRKVTKVASLVSRCGLW